MSSLAQDPLWILESQSVTAQKKDVCKSLSDLVSSLSLLILSQSRKRYLLYLFDASKHNQPFLSISSKINNLILLPSTWKEKIPLGPQNVSTGCFKFLPTFSPVLSLPGDKASSMGSLLGLSLAPILWKIISLKPVAYHHLGCKEGQSCRI